jgi:hypothetical protein
MILIQKNEKDDAFRYTMRFIYYFSATITLSALTFDLFIMYEKAHAEVI